MFQLAPDLTGIAPGPYALAFPLGKIVVPEKTTIVKSLMYLLRLSFVEHAPDSLIAEAVDIIIGFVEIL